MAFISGRHTVCADPNCHYKGGLDIKREHWDGIDHVIVGEEHCPACGCMMLYTRKPMPQERPAAATWAHMQVIYPLPLISALDAIEALPEPPPAAVAVAVDDEEVYWP